MSPEIVALLIAVAGLTVGRTVARQWVRDRWLADTLSDRTAGLLLWLVAAGPLLLIGLVALIASPSSGLVIGALLVFVLLPMTTLLVAATDYMPTRDLKQRQRDRDGVPRHDRR